jgi:hypothetical protein
MIITKSDGQQVAIDFVVTNAITKTVEEGRGGASNDGLALRTAAKRKHDKYAARTRQNGLTFEAFAATSQGAWSQDLTNLFNTVIEKKSKELDIPHTILYQNWSAEISMAIAKHDARAVSTRINTLAARRRQHDRHAEEGVDPAEQEEIELESYRARSGGAVTIRAQRPV